MKKLLAILMAILVAMTMVACGDADEEETKKKKDEDETEKASVTTEAPKETLEFFEMTVEADGRETPAKVKVGYSKDNGFEFKQDEWHSTLTQKSEDIEMLFYLSADYDCYSINQQDAKENSDFYLERKFGNYDGYVYMNDGDLDIEINIYFECVAEIDDVYMTIRIGSASLGLDVDPKAMYESEAVGKILSSITYISPAS